MTEQLEKQNKPLLSPHPQGLDTANIKLSAGALKEVHSEAETKVSKPVETKVSKSIVEDLRATVEACKNNHVIAKQYGLDDKVKLSAVDAAVAHAERTGRLPGSIDVQALKAHKSIIVNSKLNDRRTRQMGGQSRRQSIRNNPNNHDLTDLRHEILAMILNNRQLGNIQKGSKTIQEQKEELGFGEDLSGEMTVEQALEERVKFLLAEEQAAGPSQQDRASEDVEVEFFNVDVDTGFATELRNQSEFGFLQDNEGLELLLDGVVDIVPYIAEKRAKETGRDTAEISAEIFQFQELVRKRKKRGDLVADEDVETLLLVQYLPILYDAVNYIMGQNIKTENVSKMESLKGELAALIQASSDPKSKLHDMFKQIKDSLKDRELVEWTA